jgi:translation initiation factor IF-2
MGDVFIAGSHYGRVRAMHDDKGQKVESAGPSIPVEVVGFADVPEAGETFIVASDERMAKEISLYRQEKIRARELSKLSKVSLEELYEQIKKGDVKTQCDHKRMSGSIEAIKVKNLRRRKGQHLHAVGGVRGRCEPASLQYRHHQV